MNLNQQTLLVADDDYSFEYQHRHFDRHDDSNSSSHHGELIVSSINNESMPSLTVVSADSVLKYYLQLMACMGGT